MAKRSHLTAKAGLAAAGFRAALQADGTLELLVYDFIGENWWDGGGITAKTVKQQIDGAGGYQRVLIRVNSPGGDAFEGIAIYNLVRSQGKPVEVCVDGVAASAASIIAMAGDTITMGPNAMMMIHNASGFCMGMAADMRKMADALDKISGAIGQTYVTRTGKTTDEITTLMDAETWLTAQECLEQGFCTAIVAEPEVQENAIAVARGFKALGRMKNVPAALKNADPEECQCKCAGCVAGNCEDCTDTSCVDSNCEDCPMQPDMDAEAALAASKAQTEFLQARLRLLARRNASVR